jgi:archaellum component FlaC
MIKVTQATLAKIDAIEASGLDQGAKLADQRGAKVSTLIDTLVDNQDSRLEIQRMQIQAASMKKQWSDSSEKVERLEAQLDGAVSALDEMKEKLETAKTLADSRNNIIRAFKTIVDEVGF